MKFALRVSIAVDETFDEETFVDIAVRRHSE
jgi:hypothetical protein